MSFLRLTLDAPVIHQQEYAALSGRYGLQMDFASVPQLIASHGLVGAPPPQPD